MIEKRMKSLVENTKESQTAVAEMLGISQPRLNQYLNGRREPDNDFIVRFCKFFNVTPNYLFGFSEEEEELSLNSIDYIEEVIETVEFWLNKNRMKLDPKNKAKLIVTLYEETRHLPEKSRNEKIIEFTRFALKTAS